MKKILKVISVFIFFCSTAFAENYICSYPNYMDVSLTGKNLDVKKKNVEILKVKIDGDNATIDLEKYLVLQNTSLGVVLVRSFANYNSKTKVDELGLFGITINKKTLNFTSGSILDSGFHKSKNGSCIIEKK